ncbi:NAD(+)/NADH kinase [Natronomonas sp.]|uniref:NAD(+)/NADH kinase n=1 Tax=Natronomonas sp. TaxID=2184060 RepID=UPI0026131913|nr:NAD(+)/NADH kinase [Natronomonas sp.]
MHLGIVAKRDTERAVGLADRIRRSVDATVSVDELTGTRLGVDGRSVGALSACDLVVSIGGDGTFLFTAREVSPTPIMGVNLGEVGFLNAVSPDDCVEAVRAATERPRAGEAELQELPQIRASGEDGARTDEERGEGVWTLPPAVNEVVVLGPQRGRNNGLDLEVRIDGESYSEGHADGVLVSTPAGSSAYNLGEGGPLVHPDVSALVATEMCAEGSMPSIAVPTDSTLRVRIEGPDHAFVVADGRSRERVTPPTTVRLALAADPVRVAGPRLDFFAALGKLE